jgi:MFS family permease
MTQSRPATVQLGLRANWQQFAILVVVNAFVGGMVGLERVVIPLLAEQEFGLASKTAILSFIISFGVVKALVNLLAGQLSDWIGRKQVLVAGWLIGLPVPLLVIFAPSWEWIVFANVLLGINQGLCWSTTVIMKIDLVGPARRGLAMGLNEASGYLALSGAALISGYLAATYALRPAPFLLGIGFALAGLILSLFFVQESHGHARYEAQFDNPKEAANSQPSFGKVMLLTTWKDRALSSCSQAGLVNNLNEGMAWGLFPLFFASKGLSAGAIGTLIAISPAVWSLGQLFTGALSDRLGRKWLIASGMWVQAAGLAIIVMTNNFTAWTIGAVLLGAGTAMAYPTLLAAVGDVALPYWRASAVGVYRFWRDFGFAVGALLAGITTDLFGMTTAIGVVAAITAVSGVDVAVRMYETLPRARDASTGVAWEGILGATHTD